MCRTYNQNHASRAVTLIELLIATALVGILVGAVGMVYNAGFKVFYSQFTRSSIKGEAGRAFLNMSRELRQASSITSAGPSSLTFTADTNNDGIDETIQYAWSGTLNDPLNRVSAPLTNPLITSVNALAFSYYDVNNNPLAFPVTASQVRLLSIDITAVQGDEAIQLRARVDLRNI